MQILIIASHFEEINYFRLIIKILININYIKTYILKIYATQF